MSETAKCSLVISGTQLIFRVEADGYRKTYWDHDGDGNVDKFVQMNYNNGKDSEFIIRRDGDAAKYSQEYQKARDEFIVSSLKNAKTAAADPEDLSCDNEEGTLKATFVNNNIVYFLSSKETINRIKIIDMSLVEYGDNGRIDYLDGIIICFVPGSDPKIVPESLLKGAAEILNSVCGKK